MLSPQLLVRLSAVVALSRWHRWSGIVLSHGLFLGGAVLGLQIQLDAVATLELSYLTSRFLSKDICSVVVVYYGSRNTHPSHQALPTPRLLRRRSCAKKSFCRKRTGQSAQRRWARN